MKVFRRVLPIVLDVGTNNQKLLNDPRYLGIKENRMEGEEYYALIDELMASIKLRWPTALIQFEDFQSKYAIKLLQRFPFGKFARIKTVLSIGCCRYKTEYLMFNDDIQGTAATVLAGLYGAMKVQGESPEHLKNQRIVVAGAGSAGSGVILTIRNAINKRYGLSKQEASSRFFIVDKDGLISKSRSGEGSGLTQRNVTNISAGPTSQQWRRSSTICPALLWTILIWRD